MLAKQERLHIQNKSNRIAPKIDTMGWVVFFLYNILFTWAHISCEYLYHFCGKILCKKNKNLAKYGLSLSHTLHKDTIFLSSLHDTYFKFYIFADKCSHYL